jgi:hypothetical protein
LSAATADATRLAAAKKAKRALILIRLIRLLKKREPPILFLSPRRGKHGVVACTDAQTEKRTEGREDYESFDERNNSFSSSCLLYSWIALSDG